MATQLRDKNDFDPKWTGTETLIIWEVDANPKRSYGKSYARFEKYFGSVTVGEYLDAGGTKGDLRYDWEHKYLSLETAPEASGDDPKTADEVLIDAISDEADDEGLLEG